MIPRRFLARSALAAACVSFPSLHAADIVVESLSFNTVRDYASGSNPVEESVTSDTDPNGISLTTFAAEVAQAYDEGLGGIIDFEVTFPGEPLEAVDKTMVTAYMVERFKEEGRSQIIGEYRIEEVLDNPLVPPPDDPYVGGFLDGLTGEDEPLWYDSGDPGNSVVIPGTIPGYTFIDPPGEGEILATEVIDPGSGEPGFYLIDDERIITVETRFDRFSLSDTDNSFELEENEILDDISQLGATLVGRFGEGGSQTVTIRRGSLFIEEIALASRSAPGPRSQNTINDEYYFSVRPRADNGSVVPVSGNFMLNGGAGGNPTVKDLLFDPREQIVALGFTNCNFDNFQYYQGPNPEPFNADNLLVDAWFTDGTSAAFTGTTFQRPGGRLDQFFGIRAPEGEFINRLQVRVVGNNFRTFTNIDDIGFIVTPAAPFISVGQEASGIVGRDFFHRIDIQREPTSVDIPDLPAGLSFDLETGLVSGIPQAAGVFTFDVEMTNGIGTRTESVTFTFTDPDPAFGPAEVTSPESTIAILGRDFDYTITSDPEADTSFVIARRVNADASKSLTTLESIGFSLSGGLISGKALRSDVVGTYELEVYVNTPGGSAVKTVILSVFPPTPEPNFDGAPPTGNLQTDLFFFDPDTGEVSITLSPDPDDLPTADLGAVTVLTGLSPTTEILLGDFNGDSNTDFITYDPVTGVSNVHLMDGVVPLTRPFSNFGPNSGWKFLKSGDLNIDGIADVVIINPVKAWYVVRLLGVIEQEATDPGNPSGLPFPYVLKEPFVFYPDGILYGLVAFADFDGNGSNDALWRHGDTNTYTFTPFSDETFTGLANPYTGYERDSHQTFAMEDGYVPVFTGDLNGDGSTDLIWENATEGLLAIWIMSGPEVPSGLFDSETDTASAGTDTFLAPSDLAVTITNSDLNGDNNADLILQQPSGGAYAGVLFDGAGLNNLFQPEFKEDGVTPRPLHLRDDATGVQTLSAAPITKILLENFPVPGELPLALLPDEALDDYQVYEQAVDGNGNLRWSNLTDNFHTVPVADTTKPIDGRDVFFDGMHLFPGEALSLYDVYQRDGDDALGRPNVRRRFGIPQAKRVNKPRVDPGTEDRVWTPVDPSEPGVDYDLRGRRGFLQAVDILGNKQFDDFGDPIYVPWKNSLGETIPDVPGNVPWELDYDRNFSGASAEIAPGGNNLVIRAKGDFDGDGKGDLVYEDTATGEFFIYLMDGLNVLDVIAFSQGFPSPGLVTPDSPFREIEVSDVSSQFELWQQANYASPAPLEGFLLYAQGVEDIDAESPGAVEGYIMSGGIHDGEFVIEFDFRNDDPDLGYGLRATSDLESAFADIGLVFVEANPVGGKPVDRIVVKPDEAPVTQRFYQVLFDFVP